MRVAIAGTNGLACCIAHYIQQTYHSCILFSRLPKPHLRSRGWNVMVVNYSNEQQLMYSLAGVDLVISFVSGPDQLLLIDAALKAGVSRFAPAEFGGSPENRKFNHILDNGKWAALNRLGQHVEEGMEHTSIVCGLFYERFAPNGLRASEMGNVHGENNEGDFLVDVRQMKAEIPEDGSGRSAMVCMTAMDDVARFIVAALDLHLPQWPRELRICGDRMSVEDIVEMAQVIRGLVFETTKHNAASLESLLHIAQSSNDLARQHHLSLLLATSNGAFDFQSATLNSMTTVQPIRFADWFQRVWANRF